LACLPRFLHAGVLAQAGPLCLGDGGADPLPAGLAAHLQSSVDLPFFLTHSAQVQAQAEGLSHIDRDAGSAAEAFLDDQLIGTIQKAHGSLWRSSLALTLGPGPHHFILQNAAVEDAEDFCLQHLSVYTGEDDKPLPPPAPTRRSVRHVRAGGCDLPLRSDWPPSLRGGIVLSVLQGQVVGTGELLRMKPGEAWVCGVKVPSKDGRPQALSMSFETRPGQGARLTFVLDPQPPQRVDAMGYTPDHWESFQAWLCQGTLTLQLAQVPPIKIPWKEESLGLEIAAQDVEISLRAAP
jgi:hypothetical protein